MFQEHRSMNRLWILLVLTATSGVMAAGPPVVESIEPAAGKRGSHFKLAFSGTNLKEVGQLLFEHAGLQCESVRSTEENRLVAVFRAETDCDLGEVTVRAVSSRGISPPKTFWIVPFPVVAERRTAADPISLEPGTTVSGIMESAAADSYLMHSKRGERISAEVVGVRLGAGLTDTKLKLIGPDGKMLAEVDDTPSARQDPYLSIKAPLDGDYRIEVLHATRDGADEFRYLLNVGRFLRPSGVFPPGGQAGRQIQLKLTDQAGEIETLTMKLPEFPGNSGLYLSEFSPTPIPFRVSAFPDFAEPDPSKIKPGDHSPPQWPVAFNGSIDQAGEADILSFKAVAGDRIRIESHAARLGSLVDTVLKLRDSSGRVLATSDDDSSHDSRIETRISASGVHTVEVRDKRGSGGPFHHYRIEIDSPEKRVTLFQAGRNRRDFEEDAVTIPRGGRILKYLGANREGFEDAVRFDVKDLPAAITLRGSEIRPREYLVPVVWEASESARTGALLVRPEPVARAEGQTVPGRFEHRTVLVAGPGDTQIKATSSSRLPVCVVEPSPVDVEIVPLQSALVPDSHHEIQVQVIRKPGFRGAVEVSIPCLPPGVEAPVSILVPADRNDAKFGLTVSPFAEPGDWPIVVEVGPPRRGRADRDPLSVGMNGLGTPGAMASRSRSTQSADFVPVCSRLMTVRTESALMTGSIDPVICEAGKKTRVICRFDGDQVPRGRFTARLAGLPPRVVAKPVDVSIGTSLIEFEIETDATSPPGKTRSVICELVDTREGLERIYRVGRGSTITIVAPGQLRTDPSGRPLSPLESLRLESGRSGNPR